MPLRRIYLVLFLFCCCCNGTAQRLPFNFDQLKVGNDAISNQVNCLLKDRNGYLWMGTAAGLKRYDPVYTASFKRKKDDSTSLIYNNVTALCEDQQGRIWVGTSEGVCYYDRRKNLFTQLKQTKKKGAVSDNIICTSDGDVWFSLANEGVYRYDMKTGGLQNFSTSSAEGNRLSSTWVPLHGMVEDPRKTGLWIACSNGLNFYDYAGKKIYTADFNPNKIKALTKTYSSAPVVYKNKLVFSDNSALQIKWYDLLTNSFTDSLSPKSGKGFPLFYIRQLFFDRNGNLWLSTTDQRAAYIDMKQRKATDIIYTSGRKNSFSSDRFMDVLQEKNNSLWFATANGITTVIGFDAMNTNDKLFQVYDFSKQFLLNEKELDAMKSIAEDAGNGNWWIVTSNKRLINYNPTTDAFEEWKAPAEKQCVNYDVAADVHDYGKKILLFKPKAFFIFDKTVKQFSRVAMPPALANCENFFISNTMLAGDSVWLFARSKTNEAYCYNLLNNQWKAYPFVNKKSNEELWASFSCATKKGELFVAINGKGIAKFSNGKKQFEFFVSKNAVDLSQENFTGLAEDSDGNILVSTRNELMKLNTSSNEIKTVMETDLIGAIAVSSNGHLCYAALDNVFFYDEKKNGKIGFQFEVEDIFHHPGNKLISLSNGKMISLQNMELMLIDCKQTYLPSFPDQVYINHLYTNDTSILINENDSRASFVPSQNNFNIDFGIMGMPNTSVYAFSYQLEGFDKDWVDDARGTHTATYSNLSGGDYIFKVRATDVNRKTLPEQRLYIHIDTVFYKTKWFIGLMLLTILSAAVLLVRFRINKQKEIMKLETKAHHLEKEKTQVQYENLKQQLNPHFLFNSLSSLRSLIRINPPLATGFLDGLSNTYRYLLRSGDNEMVTLQEEINFVQTYVQLQKTRFEEGLQIKVDVPENLLQKKIAPVTLQGLIENAIKHNTIEEDAPLTIAIFCDDKGYVAVRNNLQRYKVVETSNKKGLEALKTLYSFLSTKPVLVEQDEKYFTVKVPVI
jgi:ligand-binding sensor domain-containing protein